MEEHILAYFSENLATVSKEELLQALKDALKSSHCWREACLLKTLSPAQTGRNVQAISCHRGRKHGIRGGEKG
ncbi:MAG: hypothetical protein ACP5SH_00190 [Syntrophobacteraceae bacterium]